MPVGSERLGILGGSFNPVHIAHLILAQEAYYRYQLSRVLFIPAARNPLKAGDPPGASPDQRLQMLHLACDKDARFTVDAFELRRPGPSYMIDTLHRLQRVHPGAELNLIIGADCAHQLHQWKDIHEYRELCRIIVTDRPGSESLAESVPAEMVRLELRWEFMHLPLIPISSSDIRQRARLGKPIRYFVPDGVAEYIRERQLYLEKD
jgi:nicotinate-nucleotide adenylyltransferase